MSYLLSGQGESLMCNISIPYLGGSTGHCAFLRVRRGRHTVRGPFLYVLVGELYCDRLRRNASKYTPMPCQASVEPRRLESEIDRRP